MSTEYEVVRVENLPVASSVSDKDSLLVWQGKNVKRVPPSLMKGKKGDQGDSSYLRYTGEWVQHKLGANGAWMNLIPTADITGPSAYELAVKNGYEGTETEWLASLSKASEDAATVALAAADEAEKTNASVAEVEGLRVEAERLRVEAENFRSKAEAGRALAEAARSTEEEKRVVGETGRDTAETLREKAEGARVEAERLRAEAEKQRALESAAAVDNADTATARANSSASAAQETADHPTYIGSDHYVYKWNTETKAYDKTDIFVKGDAFSIRKVYESVKQMEGDLSNAQVKEGDFVLINTNDVENPDNARLYIRTATGFDFLVDMSGAIGFTGKTPQLGIGTVASGEAAAVSLSEDGTDAAGNPKFKLNLVLPKGEKGDTPVLRAGTVTTGSPGTSAVAELVADGTTDTGVARYRLDLTIPRGDTGTGNVSVPATALKAGVTYLFKPSTDGSAEGEFIEYIVPTQVQSDWSATDAASDAYIQNKPVLRPVATSGSYNDLADKPTEIDSAKIASGLKNNGKNKDLNNPILVNGLSWCNDTTLNAFPQAYGNLLQISNLDSPILGGDWSWINQILFGLDNNIYHRTYTQYGGWSGSKRMAHVDEIPDLDNLTKSITINNTHVTDGTKIGVGGLMSGNDFWGIYSYSLSNDMGSLEIATGDNGNEPIYVRQYRAVPISTPISQAVRTAALLDENGNTSFPGTVSSGGQALVKTDDARLSDARYPLSIYIGEGEDLNNYTTPGLYYCQANVLVATLKNCPTRNAFSLRVEHTAIYSCVQFLTDFVPSYGLLYYRMIYFEGPAYNYGIWQRIYTTYDKPPLATTSEAGLMPAADKAFLDYFQGYNAVTSLVNLPLNKRLILCSLSSVSGSFSFNGTPESGREYHIIVSNPTSSAITQSINIGANSVYFGGNKITIPAGGYVEVNILCVDGSMFYVRSGGQ